MNVNIYGGYGGVTNNAKYVPPQVSDFIPQPSTITHPVTGRYVPPSIPDFVPQPPSIPFTKQYQDAIQQQLSGIKTLDNVKTFVLQNSATILLRYLKSLNPDETKTFIMLTSAHPNDLITYTAPSTGVDLSYLDGGIM